MSTPIGIAEASLDPGLLSHDDIILGRQDKFGNALSGSLDEVGSGNGR